MIRPSLWDAEDVFVTVVLIVVAFALLLGGTLTIRSVAADGGADFCVVEQQPTAPTIYQVWQHRPWRSDAVLMRTASFDEAVSAAARIGCPLNKVRP